MNYARFTVAYWCVLLAALMPIACAWLAKSGQLGKPRKDGGFDNHDPRGWMARQKDWRARANAAQANSFEALPFFMGAVIIAHQLGAPQARLDILAFVYIVLRMIYVVLYVAGLPTARSAVWALALLVNVGILFVGYR
ncbi:MAG: MAPEG family protein [Ramlibacter sp.]|nr:MAPEG family protein [Ramlibacter sp.]